MRVRANEAGHRQPLVTAGILLGLGLGGFVDGIVLHQVLQWHHMLSSGPYPPTNLSNLQADTLWDGLFHVVAWLFTAAGLSLLWRAGGRADVPWSRSIFTGSLAMGWGLFNLVEGIIDHQILGIHHVRENVPNVLIWDLGFLAFGAILLAGGWAMVRSGAHARDVAGVG
jgi:uncharacterized membrane protein